MKGGKHSDAYLRRWKKIGFLSAWWPRGEELPGGKYLMAEILRGGREIAQIDRGCTSIF